jgi:hypothetical protein
MLELDIRYLQRDLDDLRKQFLDFKESIKKKAKREREHKHESPNKSIRKMDKKPSGRDPK